MTISKTTPKPRNWQDFERLCLKLFGEEWGIPIEIKGNGRSGQEQCGVDIYGIPAGYSQYWGIQCKGKDDYTQARLDAKEIDAEIERAKNFNPKLGALVFATTANKDSKIEEHIRIRDLESRQRGEFKILLFCWEDLAELIDRNRATYRWWVEEKRHRTRYGVTVSFSDGEVRKVVVPKFRKITEIFYYEPPPAPDSDPSIIRVRVAGRSARVARIRDSPMNSFLRHGTTRRKSLSRCPVEIKITNSGQEVIEDYRLEFKVEGDIEEIGERQDVPLAPEFAGLHESVFSFSGLDIDEDKLGAFEFRPLPFDRRPLIQEDNRSIVVYIKPKPAEYEIPIRWKIYARDYSASGELILCVKPEFDEFEEHNAVSEERFVKTRVEFEEVFDESSDE